MNNRKKNPLQINFQQPARLKFIHPSLSVTHTNGRVIDSVGWGCYFLSKCTDMQSKPCRLLRDAVVDKNIGPSGRLTGAAYGHPSPLVKAQGVLRANLKGIDLRLRSCLEFTRDERVDHRSSVFRIDI